jgi:uncharacterized protein (DUF433 family)
MAEFGNVIAAFSEEQVERLTGLTKRRLRYWDNTNFFKPSLGDENRRVAYSRIYTFKDVATLRVIANLVNQYSVPLQHLRKVRDKLANMGEDRWTITTLYVWKQKVVFFEPGSEMPREIVSGQFMLQGIKLAQVVSDARKAVETLHARVPDSKGKLERNRAVAHNAWVVKGTRIPVKAIKDFREAGYSIEQIIAEYPDLTPQDVEAALTHRQQDTAA